MCAAAAPPLRALEFYSGIGGMAAALATVAPDARVLAAFDVNEHANATYRHNHGLQPCQTDLCTLTAAELDAYAADLWLLAPPCQPFTRTGKRLGGADARSASLRHLLRELAAMAAPPRWLLLENVVGFERSDVWAELARVLAGRGYSRQDFHLSPLQLGVPYSRPRFFCVAARQQALPVHLPCEVQPCQCTPSLLLQLRAQHADQAAINAAAQQPLGSHLSQVPTLGEFLSLGAGGVQEQLAQPQASRAPPLQQSAQPHEQQQEEVAWAPEAVLRRHADVIDVVALASRTCNCFTKAYGHYARGSGSLLATVPDPAAVDDRWALVGGSGSLELRGYVPPSSSAADGGGDHSGSDSSGDSGGGELAAAWRRLRPRYFTPREIAVLHSLPRGFSFPAGLSRKQRCRLLGNSLSVAVVADLLAYLLSPPAAAA